MELLRRIEDRGYPSDYLLSRLKGKRSRLISDWMNVALVGDPRDFVASCVSRGFVKGKSADGIWRDLMKEYEWVYTRMSREWRDIFGPFFLYAELRTVFICLRQIRGRGASGYRGMLSSSLLSEDLKMTLQESGDIAAAAADIERAFLPLSDTFTGIAVLCDTEGLSVFERELTTRYLVTMVRNHLHPLMKAFFIRIIDSRNIIALVKYLMLSPKKAPGFVPCGRITEKEFSSVILSKELRDIQRLARVKDAGSGLLSIEQELYRQMTLFLRRAGRDSLAIGPVLDYLWRCSVEVMNLSILFHGRGMDRDIISRELVH